MQCACAVRRLGSKTDVSRSLPLFRKCFDGIFHRSSIVYTLCESKAAHFYKSYPFRRHRRKIKDTSIDETRETLIGNHDPSEEEVLKFNRPSWISIEGGRLIKAGDLNQRAMLRAIYRKYADRSNPVSAACPRVYLHLDHHTESYGGTGRWGTSKCLPVPDDGWSEKHLISTLHQCDEEVLKIWQ